VTDLCWRDDLQLLELAAKAVCLPCRQLMPLKNQNVHEVAPNGISVFCSAAPINELMEIRMITGVPGAWWSC